MRVILCTWTIFSFLIYFLSSFFLPSFLPIHSILFPSGSSNPSYARYLSIYSFFLVGLNEKEGGMRREEKRWRPETLRGRLCGWNMWYYDVMCGNLLCWRRRFCDEEMEWVDRYVAERLIGFYIVALKMGDEELDEELPLVSGSLNLGMRCFVRLLLFLFLLFR